MKDFIPVKRLAVIHSLDGKLAEANILDKLGDNDYLAEFNGVKCHAIFNIFTCRFYLDDVYAIVED